MTADIIGLVGFARTGKNSFAEFLIEKTPYTLPELKQDKEDVM